MVCFASLGFFVCLLLLRKYNVFSLRLFLFYPDIVFFIFLYQRWIYKVDHKRVNEFGFSGEMVEDAKKQVVPVLGDVPPDHGPALEAEVAAEKTEAAKKTD